MKHWVRLTALLLCGVVSTAAFAAQLGDSPNRSELHRADLSGAPGMEVIASIVRIKPGETAPAHSHHGVEAAYVLQGAMVQYPGHAPRLLKTGTTLFNLRDVVHSGFTVVGHTTLVIYTVHVVDKDKPLYQPAAAPAQ